MNARKQRASRRENPRNLRFLGEDSQGAKPLEQVWAEPSVTPKVAHSSLLRFEAQGIAPMRPAALIPSRIMRTNAPPQLYRGPPRRHLCLGATRPKQREPPLTRRRSLPGTLRRNRTLRSFETLVRISIACGRLRRSFIELVADSFVREGNPQWGFPSRTKNRRRGPRYGCDGAIVRIATLWMDTAGRWKRCLLPQTGTAFCAQPQGLRWALPRPAKEPEVPWILPSGDRRWGVGGSLPRDWENWLAEPCGSVL